MKILNRYRKLDVVYYFGASLLCAFVPALLVANQIENHLSFIAIFLLLEIVIALSFLEVAVRVERSNAKRQAALQAQFEEKYPTVSEYQNMQISEYSELYEEEPDSFALFCPHCGKPVRVWAEWQSFGDFDPNDGIQTHVALVVACEEIIERRELTALSPHIHHLFVREFSKKEKDKTVFEDDEIDFRYRLAEQDEYRHK